MKLLAIITFVFILVIFVVDWTTADAMRALNNTIFGYIGYVVGGIIVSITFIKRIKHGN